MPCPIEDYKLTRRSPTKAIVWKVSYCYFYPTKPHNHISILALALTKSTLTACGKLFLSLCYTFYTMISELVKVSDIKLYDWFKVTDHEASTVYSIARNLKDITIQLTNRNKYHYKEGDEVERVVYMGMV